MSLSRSQRLYIGSFRVLNRFVEWHRLPTWLGLFNAHAIRVALRQHNLYPREIPTSATGRLTRNTPFRSARTADGSYNDLACPDMGKAQTPFGRNVPPEAVVLPERPESISPAPREISRRLMTRDEFQPATSLNLLAAAWIQFEVHDWFDHKTERDKRIALSAPTADNGRRPDDDSGRRVMEIEPTFRDSETGSFINDATHWWDGSQLYGSRAEFDDPSRNPIRERKDGRLRLGPDGLLPVANDTGLEITGRNDSWWVGLSLLHTLFTLEHNAICDRLRAEYPNWDDQQLFVTGRLVNAALIAKIHILEWTPAILGHPVLRVGMRGTWWGLAGERIRRAAGRISRLDEVSGIPGSTVDHHAAAYAITEEFVSVYRMHPLLPDDLPVYSVTTGAPRQRLRLRELLGVQTHGVMDQLGAADLLYSFGIAHPGRVTLKNFPRDLQELDLNQLKPTDTARDGSGRTQVGHRDVIDLAAVDIFRDRERGVPRYNAFRRALGLRAIRSFDELNPRYAEDLRVLYGGRPDQGVPDRVDDLDLMVGLYAEEPPPGFGFSDTAFRIFILMNGRRLKSDRFFTDDFRPAVYTEAGLDWIANNDLRSVLLRHYPQLRPALHRVPNPFAPWRRTIFAAALPT